MSHISAPEGLYETLSKIVWGGTFGLLYQLEITEFTCRPYSHNHFLLDAHTETVKWSVTSL